MKTKLTAIYLAFIMVASSLGSVACDRDQIRQTREAAERLIIYSEAAIDIIEEPRESGALTGGVVSRKQILAKGKDILDRCGEEFKRRLRPLDPQKVDEGHHVFPVSPPSVGALPPINAYGETRTLSMAVWLAIALK
jgi:hypothetical protein